MSKQALTLRLFFCKSRIDMAVIGLIMISNRIVGLTGKSKRPDAARECEALG